MGLLLCFTELERYKVLMLAQSVGLLQGDCKVCTVVRLSLIS